VVAQEIRNLAETSRRSVDEAAVVVAAIRDSVQRMVAGLDRPVGEEHRTPAVEAAADLQRALGDVRALVDRMRGGL
jgi:methyl-accepting chemotaxis protein